MPSSPSNCGIFIAGAGGGFDVFSGLPLYFGLRAAGKKVTLANLSFSKVPMLWERFSQQRDRNASRRPDEPMEKVAGDAHVKQQERPHLES